MPYTPPSHRSPASSASVSPDVSRRSSIQSASACRPSLPRSASYLTKHRRTPSALGSDSHEASQPTPPGSSEDIKGQGTNNTVRQSPPPVRERRGMPSGVVISPPESVSSGSDDEGADDRSRRIENLRELKDALGQIPQRRESSPNKDTVIDAGDLHVLPSQRASIVDGMHHSFSTPSLSTLVRGSSRRVSHVRSNTEPSVGIKSGEASLTGSDEESDGESQKKPQMVRKKSGELVRPALRPASRQRPSSMPGTPTFSKSVHFDSHEHVRHFLQVDRPLAVSAGSSPVDNYESDNEYPFPGGERLGTRSPPYEWEITTTNFPTETPIRRAQPARLERVWLSNDQRCLLGSVAVVNLAFQKQVTCRFTLDYWKTTSEVAAEYSHEIRQSEGGAGHDRFTFTIKLSEIANLESKTLYFCLRYNVNGQEFWDSNNSANFQIDFRKKHLPQNGKKNFQEAPSRGTDALPRSTRRASPSTIPRPKSMPVAFDEFGSRDKFNFDQPIYEYLGESGPTLRLRTNRSAGNLPSDNLSNRLSAPSGQAFANRYDFGASLSAAVQAAKDTMGRDRDGLYMKHHRKVAIPERKQSSLDETISYTAPPGTDWGVQPPAGPLSASNPRLASASYEELVNKYCFFGSKQSSPQIKEGTLKSARQYDGTDDGFATRGSNSTNSSLNGSPQLHHVGPARHHGMHPSDPSPYFAPSQPTGASAAAPPRRNLAPAPVLERSPSPSSTQRPASLGSASPNSVASDFAPFATSPTDFTYAPHMQERFPFSNTENHTATASCG